MVCANAGAAHNKANSNKAVFFMHSSAAIGRLAANSIPIDFIFDDSLIFWLELTRFYTELIDFIGYEESRNPFGVNAGYSRRRIPGPEPAAREQSHCGACRRHGFSGASGEQFRAA